MGFFHCWCQKWPLPPQKVLFTHFFLYLSGQSGVNPKFF
uniref:Uncharacterized protein n=1 Tax=Lepeophtheirus salmonis TaxID=72036 RepID=A0A0K2TQF7_LEPSM